MVRKQTIQQDDDQLAADLREAFGFTSGIAQEFANSEARRLHGRSSAGLPPFYDGPCPIGARIGDFKILDELGRGGMGVVYRAHQLSLNREVALKVLPGYSQRGARAIQRFLLEAQAAARLHHTNIVPIYAQGESDGHFFYAMEMIEGGSLDSAIRERSRILSPSNIRLSDNPVTLGHRLRLGEDSGSNGDIQHQEPLLPQITHDAISLHRKREDFQHLAHLLSEVADGLEHAHQAGVIHRDIKPLNLLVDQKGRLHITDFGLARLTGSPTLTMSGEVLGTPAYLSPEQVDPSVGQIDHRTDVYSLGVTLYELLTLRRPFEGETREQIITGIRHIPPRPPRQFDPCISKDLQTICLKALEKEQDQRYQSAADMGEDLLRFSEGRPILSRPPNVAVRAGKWARRHKAATTAIVALALVVSLGAALAASIVSSRRERAAQLIDDAYDKMVYSEPRHYSDVEDEIDQAEELGADPATVAFLRGLGAFSDGRVGEEIGYFEKALEADPTSAAPYYLLAVSYERKNQPDRAADYLTIAPPPVTAVDWYFRGHALHNFNPAEAIECYHKARAKVASQGQPFLQASLQIGRALNQLMFAERDITRLPETTKILQSLETNNVYAARVYYLLSIANRLAGEILADAPGARPDESERYFEKALEYARTGEQIEPDQADLYQAEAHCLEMQGDFENAIDVRTEAIRVGGTVKQRVLEGLHFRWRLYYWTGRYDAALDDVRSLTEGLENTPLHFIYQYFYPALIYAEMDRLDHAKALALAMVDDVDQPLVPARRLIWAATTLRILGDPDLADETLARYAGQVDFEQELEPWQSTEWMEALYGLVVGENDVNTLLDLAERAHENGLAQPWRLTGEAHFHAAAIKLSLGDRPAAFAAFDHARRSFDSIQRYTFHARIICEQMSDNPAWPTWIPANGIETGSPSGVKER